MWARSNGLQRDIVGIEIRVFRHVEVRRVTLLDGSSNGVRKPGVWSVPRAPISRNRAAHGVAWEGQDALDQRRPDRQVIALGEKGRERLGRHGNDEIRDGNLPAGCTL